MPEPPDENPSRSHSFQGAGPLPPLVPLILAFIVLTVALSAVSTVVIAIFTGAWSWPIFGIGCAVLGAIFFRGVFVSQTSGKHPHREAWEHLMHDRHTLHPTPGQSRIVEEQDEPETDRPPETTDPAE